MRARRPKAKVTTQLCRRGGTNGPTPPPHPPRREGPGIASEPERLRARRPQATPGAALQARGGPSDTSLQPGQESAPCRPVPLRQARELPAPGRSPQRGRPPPPRPQASRSTPFPPGLASLLRLATAIPPGAAPPGRALPLTWRGRLCRALTTPRPSRPGRGLSDSSGGSHRKPTGPANHRPP